MPSPEEQAEYEEFLAWKASQRAAQAAPQPRVQAYSVPSVAGQPVGPQDWKRPQGATPASQWKRARSNEVELTLPSGNVCLVRRPGMVALFREGVIPELFTGLVEKQIAASEGERPDEHSALSHETESEWRKIMADPKGRDAMFDVSARVTAACVLQPPVLYHRVEIKHPDGTSTWEDIPECQDPQNHVLHGNSDRDPEQLYTDDVDLDDQMFIFQFVVGGSQDLNQFRK